MFFGAVGFSLLKIAVMAALLKNILIKKRAKTIGDPIDLVNRRGIFLPIKKYLKLKRF